MSSEIFHKPCFFHTLTINFLQHCLKCFVLTLKLEDLFYYLLSPFFFLMPDSPKASWSKCPHACVWGAYECLYCMGEAHVPGKSASPGLKPTIQKERQECLQCFFVRRFFSSILDMGSFNNLKVQKAFRQVS